jgi:hypothetical protein
VEEGNHHIFHWKEGAAYHIDHSPETPEVDSRENMQLGPQSRSIQSETRNGEAEEAHAFCNRPHPPYELGEGGIHDSPVGERWVF